MAMTDTSGSNGNSGSSGPPRRGVGSSTLPSAVVETGAQLVEAVSALYEDTIDRVLSTSDRVTSAAEGKALLAADERAEAATDRVQRVVVVAVPIVRRLARGVRFTRVPWVLAASTAFSIASTVRTGVREAQVIGSLVAHRLAEATGLPADPALVKKLTLELYLSPRTTPDVSPGPLPLGRLVSRWVLKGAFGRDTRKAASKALDAAEKLDLRPYIEQAAGDIG
jgi:hypothetical protein